LALPKRPIPKGLLAELLAALGSLFGITVRFHRMIRGYQKHDYAELVQGRANARHPRAMMRIIRKSHRNLIIRILRQHGGNLVERPRDVVPDLIASEALAESIGVLLRAGPALRLDPKPPSRLVMPSDDVNASLASGARAFDHVPERWQVSGDRRDDVILREHRSHFSGGVPRCFNSYS
jgi:hypothetical protein